MAHLTRRSLLKTGLAASAGLMMADGALDLPPAEAATQEHTMPAGSDAAVADTASPRERLLLDAGWRFHLGNAADAAKDFGFGAPTREGTFAKSGEIWIRNIDDSAWRTVDLPHDWAVELPFVEVPEPDITAHAAHGGKPLGRGFPETSIGWYRRTFDIPAQDEGRRISLDFDGVFRDAMITFNGYYIGTNLSGYAPFGFDVTDYVNYGGENLLMVRVDATLNEGWYYEGAGIYRHVWLTKTDPLHIARWGTFVRSEVRKKDALVSVDTEIMNESRQAVKGRLAARILDPDGKPVATAPAKSFQIPARGTLTLATQATIKDPSLWSIEAPRLYRVVSQIESEGRVTDHADTPFGIRSIRFDPDHGFFLNEKPVKIKGTCNHQDHGGVGIAVPDRLHADRVALLKQMGSNAWRTAHDPASSELLDACDRQGMLVMSETRLMASTPEGLSQLERMIRRDRNHPCVVIWSLANEEHHSQGTAMGARIFSGMKDVAGELDPTRPVTAAMDGDWGKGFTEAVDVMGFNYWNIGSSSPADIDAFHQRFPKLPTIGTEVSNCRNARGIYETVPKRGYVSAYKADDPDGQAPAEVWWSVYDARPFLSGGFTWVGFDYRGEPNPYDHVAVTSQTGALDACGFPKDIFYYYKAWWGTEPVLHLFPHWNWPGREGQNVDVRCYSNLDSAELLLNGKSLGAKPMARNAHLTWSVPYEPGVLEAHGFKDGQVVLTDRRETTGPPAKLALRPNAERIAADGTDVSSVAVEVQDAQGRVVPTASNSVRFRLTGPGKIIGVGNGDPSSREADKPDAPDAAGRSAFNGLCMAFVQSTKQEGLIQIGASAEGLTSAQVVIQSAAGKIRPSVG